MIATAAALLTGWQGVRCSVANLEGNSEKFGVFFLPNETVAPKITPATASSFGPGSRAVAPKERNSGYPLTVIGRTGRRQSEKGALCCGARGSGLVRPARVYCRPQTEAIVWQRIAHRKNRQNSYKSACGRNRWGYNRPYLLSKSRIFGLRRSPTVTQTDGTVRQS